MVFHLDKCIGCHTCSMACKNIWTNRKGSEYMWWNNVETRPGLGFPKNWEDQEKHNGGWELEKGKTLLKFVTGARKLGHLPEPATKGDYYDPFDFRYQDLFNGGNGKDQPTAIPISLETGDPIEIKSGPNWDDDLSGSNIYAKNDPNFRGVPPDVQTHLQEVERIVIQYLPRICNHCLHPSCVTSCPVKAIYTRPEDGIVLVDQKRCEAHRHCISACPYWKTYFNFATHKTEKCILCYPRLEAGEAPACFHTCVGRHRYLGIVLYDADMVGAAAAAPEGKLIEAEMDLILDPFDSQVVQDAKANGITDEWIRAAQESPPYKFFKIWKIALPLHPEYRNLPPLFYVPPLGPIVASVERDLYKLNSGSEDKGLESLQSLEDIRLPLKYLANLFSAGDGEVIGRVLKKVLAVRIFKRHQSLNGKVDAETEELLAQGGTTVEEAESIYKLTTLASGKDMFVIPPYHKEAK